MTRPASWHRILLLPVAWAMLHGGAAIAQSTSNAFELPPLDAFDAIVERPLFSPDRRPVVTDPPSPTETSETEAVTAEGQLLLSGTVTDQGERAVAILHDVAQGTQYRVWVGDQVAGWTVRAIGPSRIVLANAGQEVTVTLDEPVLPRPPGDD